MEVANLKDFETGRMDLKRVERTRATLTEDSFMVLVFLRACLHSDRTRDSEQAERHLSGSLHQRLQHGLSR